MELMLTIATHCPEEVSAMIECYNGFAVELMSCNKCVSEEYLVRLSVVLDISLVIPWKCTLVQNKACVGLRL